MSDNSLVEEHSFRNEARPNSRLSIVIPTYNRAKFLDHCLGLIIPIAEKYNIAIYISDNASSDNTGEIVERRRAAYAFIEYSRNQQNLGPDKNFEIALKMPDTDYVWLLGDTYHIRAESVDHLFELFSYKNVRFDAIVLNVESRVKNTRSNDYTDKNLVLNDLGWHMTCMSSLIYSRKLITGANFERYRNTNFIQTGIIFEYIENREFLIRWANENSVLSIVLEGVEKTSWQANTFEIWLERWSNFVFSLPPSYPLKTKLACIKAHGKKSGLFSVGNLLSLRSSGILTVAAIKKFGYLLSWTIFLPPIIVFAISVLPKKASRVIKWVYNKRTSLIGSAN